MAVTLEELHQARRIAAKIVKRDGPAFLPIFERLDLEIESEKSKDEKLSRALSFAEEEAS